VDDSILKCSLDQQRRQPNAAQQVLNGYGKLNESAEASLKVISQSEKNLVF
jgi:hypothetical protein